MKIIKLWKIFIINVINVIKIILYKENEKMATIIDGKALAKKIRGNLKAECDELKKGGII